MTLDSRIRNHHGIQLYREKAQSNVLTENGLQCWIWTYFDYDSWDEQRRLFRILYCREAGEVCCTWESAPRWRNAYPEMNANIVHFFFIVIVTFQIPCARAESQNNKKKLSPCPVIYRLHGKCRLKVCWKVKSDPRKVARNVVYSESCDFSVLTSCFMHLKIRSQQVDQKSAKIHKNWWTCFFVAAVTTLWVTTVSDSSIMIPERKLTALKQKRTDMSKLHQYNVCQRCHVILKTQLYYRFFFNC